MRRWPPTERPAVGDSSTPSADDHWLPRRPSLEDPLTWAVPLGRLAGVNVRVHLLFVLFGLVLVLKAAVGAPAGSALTSTGWGLVALLVGALLVIVLAHEFGHCLACRRVGGVADEVLLWPLGGLAACRPPRRWSAHLITALGGPAVNLLICLVATVALGLRTGRWLGVAIPSPLSFDELLYSYGLGAGDWSWSLIALFVINWTSLVVLLLNLLPLFPLDGGRILHALLWPRLGEVRAMRVTIGVGYVSAMLLGIAGAVFGNWILFGIALLGGFVCHRTQRRLQFTESLLSGEGEAAGAAIGAANDPAAEEAGADDVETGPIDEADELDQILAIIADRGLGSLTPRQRRVLERETARRREADDHDPEDAGG